MSKSNGERLRVLRRRIGMTQVELAELAGISRRMVERIENGHWDTVTHGATRRVADGLGAQLRVTIAWQGELLDRLVDAGHAELQNAFTEMLVAAGWLTTVELSFNRYGERGRYDILARHPASGILLLVEVKTGVGDVQAMLGTLDVKTRVAAVVAQQKGWPRPTSVIPALVVADERQQHRLVAGHSALFAHFDLRGRPARAWLKRPAVVVRDGTSEPSGLLVYLPMTNARLVSVRRARRGSRVRKTAAPMTKESPAAHMSRERVPLGT